MSTSGGPSRWLALIVGAAVLGAASFLAVRAMEAGEVGEALAAAEQALAQDQAGWVTKERQLEDEVRGLRAAIAGVSDTLEVEQLLPRERFVSVSLHERWLELVEGDKIIWSAPVAIGRGFRDQEDQMFFSTPRGRREIVSKVKNPIWVPPAWHYREVSGWSGAKPVELQRGGAVNLSDGSKIVVRNNSVGRVTKAGGFKAYKPGSDVVVDGKVIVPPFGTKQRRKPFVMGSRKLGLGMSYAIHGTNKPGSIGRAASHGCLRMLNKDIEELYTMVEVGTPVFIY